MNRPQTAIEVLKIRRVAGMGSVRAFVSLRLGSVVIHGVKVIQQPGQKAWCALPQQASRAKADGSGAGWFAVVEIVNPELLDRVRRAVLEAWERGA